MYDGLKSVLGIWIRIWFDLDLFDKIQTPERAMVVRGTIFSASDNIRFLVAAKSANLRTSV
jgi:hypothetical protein